jgi:hypothetical protein
MLQGKIGLVTLSLGNHMMAMSHAIGRDELAATIPIFDLRSRSPVIVKLRPYGEIPGRIQGTSGIQIVTPPLPIRVSKVELCRSKTGASAGVLPLAGNQSFQIAT